MSSAENEPLALWSRVQGAAPGLRALSVQDRAHAIATACAALSMPTPKLVTRLATSAGLSEPMARWALETTFEAFSMRALLELAASAQPAGRSVAAILAGNVLTAAARPMLLPLLAGAPVVAKASSRDDALPHAIARAMSAAHPLIGAACAVATFSQRDTPRLDALLASAESVQVLGSDETVAAIRERLRPDQTLLGRGHGLGIGVVLRDATLIEAAAGFARDVAAYDQRGCLSPHAILVEGDDARAEAFAKLLHNGLAWLERELPRGNVTADAQAEQLQWRGVAAARGVLHESAAFAVSCEHRATLRPSPGYRNVSVYTLRNRAELATRLGPLARFVKALGIAGSPDDNTAPTLAALAPYVAAAGTMQTPPLDAHLDGLHPLEGL